MEWVMRRPQNNYSGWGLGMRAEHLKGWLAEAQKDKADAAKVAEGKEVAIRGPGGEDTEGDKEK